MSAQQRKRVPWLVSQMARCVWTIAMGMAIGEAHAASSRQTAMASIADLYDAHQVIAQLRIVSGFMVNDELYCYEAQMVRVFKGQAAARMRFISWQRAAVGAEYLVAADVDARAVKGCPDAPSFRSASGGIFYPIVRAGALRDGERWIAMRGVQLRDLPGSSMLDGSSLCQLDTGKGTGELLSVCDTFGAVVRWAAVERALTARAHTCAGGTACLKGAIP
jgi:hypothetical protein